MSTTAPGYEQDEEAGTPVSVVRPRATLAGVRASGDFLVRGRNHVDSVKGGGWVVTEEDGHVSGWSDSDFDRYFLAPPSLFVDAITGMAAATVGVAYNQTVTLQDHSGLTVTAATLNFPTGDAGNLYAGLSLDFSDPSAPILSGTPVASDSFHSWCYFEIKYTLSNHKSMIQRYCLEVIQ